MTLQHGVAMNAGEGYAHQGPIFAPWHRMFLQRMELAIKRVISPTYGPQFGLSYWDWAEQTTEAAFQQAVFTDGEDKRLLSSRICGVWHVYVVCHDLCMRWIIFSPHACVC